MKSLMLFALTLCLSSGTTFAATIAVFDFENYVADSTDYWGNTHATILADGGDVSTLPRQYNANNSLPTGVASVSPVTFVAGGTTGGQNRLEDSARPSGLAGNVISHRYRWRMTTTGTTELSFSVTLDAGYQLENFSLALVQTGNATGTFEAFYNGSNSMGSGNLDFDDDYDGDNDVFSSNTIASSVTGTVNFLISVSNTTANRTSRWDDIVLSGDIVAVPEPSAAALMMTGLLGCVCLRRRR